MSPLLGTLAASSSRFPRVSGDEPVGLSRLPLRRVFSPRERG